jgi:hypothetical protein
MLTIKQFRKRFQIHPMNFLLLTIKSHTVKTSKIIFKLMISSIKKLKFHLMKTITFKE